MPNDEFSIQRRFWKRVKPDVSGCWIWVGGVRKNGYGTFAVKTKNGRWTQTTSHRFAYQDQVGAIPTDYEVDHLCRVRQCVRPEHLEAVTVAENRHRRDLKTVFTVPTNCCELPVVPPKPTPPPKRDPTKACKNGHEYAAVGKVKNGRFSTCARCRKIESRKRIKNNAAADRAHCPKGHSYSGDNLLARTRTTKKGTLYNSRECWTCTRARYPASYRRTA